MTYRSRLRSPAVHAVRDLSLAARPGEIVGILGPNGSGKTTLLDVIAGSLAPTAGRVRVLGLPPSDRGLVRRVGYQPEGPLPFPALSGTEFLRYLGALMGLDNATTRARTGELLERFDLLGAQRRGIGTYSTGMSRRLALAAALLAEPEVLLLDEPTSGIDPTGSLRVLDVVREVAARGGTVVMASHHLQEVEQVCDSVFVLEGGTCRAHGSLDELLGTSHRTLVVRGLDDASVGKVRPSIEGAGGELVSVGRDRQHLFALFRDLEDEAPEPGTSREADPEQDPT